MQEEAGTHTQGCRRVYCLLSGIQYALCVSRASTALHCVVQSWADRDANVEC